MGSTDRFPSLLRRIQAKTRYHTAGSQTLALAQQLALAVFLLTGWQKFLIALICWGLFWIIFALFTQSRMVVERPSNRALRRFIREIEVVLTILNAALIVFLSGSVTNMLILFFLYVLVALLTSEFHGRRWIQFD
jgi:hypothetical protein